MHLGINRGKVLTALLIILGIGGLTLVSLEGRARQTADCGDNSICMLTNYQNGCATSRYYREVHTVEGDPLTTQATMRLVSGRCSIEVIEDYRADKFAAPENRQLRQDTCSRLSDGRTDPYDDLFWVKVDDCSKGSKYFEL